MTAPATTLQLKVRRCWYIAVKYWRMNPLKYWWVLHLVDEIKRQKDPHYAESRLKPDGEDRP